MKTVSILGMAALSLLWGCGADGGSSLVCGEGTSEVEGECVADDPVDPVDPVGDTTAPVTSANPADGRIAANGAMVILTANEPATIYYTTDGSAPSTSSDSGVGAAFVQGLSDSMELRFFAMDVAGNEETPQTLSITLDDEVPNPVTNLLATVSGSDVTLTWTNPSDADFAGVVVAASQSGDVPVANPGDGQTYNVGDQLPGLEQVLAVGDINTAMDAPIGGRTYAVWAVDEAGNYSLPRTVRAEVALPAQTATLTIDRDAGTVTVTTQPANFRLSTFGYDFDIVNDRLRFGLGVENNTSGVAFSLKALMTPSEGILSANGTFDGTSYLPYGPEGLLRGGSRFEEVLLNNIVTDTGTMTVDVTLRTDPTAMFRDDITDLATGDQQDTDPDGDLLGASVSSDGLRALFADKNADQLSVIDTTRPEAEFEINLPTSTGVTSIGGPAIDGFYGYAVYTDGAHGWGGADINSTADSADLPSTVRVLKVDIRDLSIKGSIELVAQSADRPVAKGLSLSADGTTLGVAVSRFNTGTAELWMLNAGDLSVIDADAGTAGNQPVALSASQGLIQQSSYSPDGARIYVSYRNRSGNSGDAFNRAGGDGTTAPVLDQVDTSTFAVTQIPAPNASTAGTQIVERNGMIFYGTRGGLYKIPVAGGAAVEVTGLPMGEIGGIIFNRSGSHYYVTGTSNDTCVTVRVDASNDTVVNTLANETQLSQCGRPHSNIPLL